jgi:predicted  nucleic acid-binding Zn-ribbon protein
MPRQQTDSPSEFPWKLFFSDNPTSLKEAKDQCSASSTASLTVKKAVTVLKAGDQLGTKEENCEKVINQANLINRQISLVPTAQRENKRQEVINYYKLSLEKKFDDTIELPDKPDLPYLEDAAPKPRAQRRGSLSDEEDEEKELSIENIIEAEAIIYFRKSFPSLSISVFRNSMLEKYPDVDPDLPKQILTRIFKENASSGSDGKKSKNVPIAKYNEALDLLKRSVLAGKKRPSPPPSPKAEPKPAPRQAAKEETINIAQLKAYIQDRNWILPKTNDKEELFVYILKNIDRDVSDLMNGYNIKEEEIEQLKNEIKDIKEKYKSFKQKNLEANKKIEDLEQLIEKLEKQPKKSEEDIEEIRVLNEKLEKLKEKLEVNQNNLLSEKRKASDLEKMIEKLEEKNNKSEEEIKRLNRLKNDYEDKYYNALNAPKAIEFNLEKRLKEKQEALDDVKKQLEEMKSVQEEYSGLCFQMKDWMKDEKFDLKIAESDLTCPPDTVCDIDKGKCIKYIRKPIDVLNKRIMGSIENVDGLINVVNKRISDVEKQMLKEITEERLKTEREMKAEIEKKAEEMKNKRDILKKEEERLKQKEEEIEEEERLKKEEEEKEAKRLRKEEKRLKKEEEKKRKEEEEREEEERLQKEEEERQERKRQKKEEKKRKADVKCATKDSYTSLEEMEDDLKCKDDMVCDVDNKKCIESEEYTEIMINNKKIKVSGKDEVIDMITAKIASLTLPSEEVVEEEKEIVVERKTEQIVPVDRKSLDSIVNTLSNILIKKPMTTAQSKIRMADRKASDKIAKCAGLV